MRFDGNPLRKEQNVRRAAASKLKVRRQPVQRAASRLYRAGAAPLAGKSGEGCVGPEFIVRAAHPSRQLHLSPAASSGEKRTVVVVLLSGQKIDVSCDPHAATAGQVFQAVVQLERLEHNFMLGLSALVGGDFVFLPDDYRIRKVAPEVWCSNSAKKKSPKKSPIPDENLRFTLFLRIKFFMPPNLSKAVRGGAWRGWVYLQLRRSVVEGQITLHLVQLVELAGYALQAEFGNYSFREHSSGDYYLMEHYFPEGSFSENDSEMRLLLKQAHESHKNMTSEEAKEKFISVVQTFKDYGSHFYTAVWATRDGFTRDVWLSISPRGMILYSRNTCITALARENTSSRILLQSLAWQHIHTLYYNKRTLYVIPNDRAAVGHNKSNLKFKLKMDSNKSYFTFWLASLHHRFYMRLHADINSLLNISDEFSIPLHGDSDNKSEKAKPNAANSAKSSRRSSTAEANDNTEAWVNECSNFQDSYNMAVRGQYQLSRKKSSSEFPQDRRLEEFQNKENEKPSKHVEQISGDGTAYWSGGPTSMDGANASSSEVLSSPESCSLPRRLGVKMGTRAFNGSSHPTSYQHKQFHSLDATQIGISPSFSDQMNRLAFSPERLVHSDIELASNLSDSDDPASGNKAQGYVVNRMNILPQRNYNCEASRSTTNVNSAYVIDSPQVANNTFGYHPQNDETLLNCSLQDRLNSMGCVQSERCFRTVGLTRDSNGALGMQVAEGSDGNVYVKSITPNGPAAALKQIYPGDQIISVNGQTLLNLNYNKALSMLQKAPKQVEIILLQTVPMTDGSRRNTSISNNRDLLRKHSLSGDMSNNIVARLLNGSSFSKLSLYNSGTGRNDSNVLPNDVSYRSEHATDQHKNETQNFDNDLLNMEALKTINVLLALTKHNIERKSSFNLNANNNSLELVQNKPNDVSKDPIDTFQYSSSTESTPSKRPHRNKTNSFSTTQENKNYKRRPLSVHIPANVDIFGTLDSAESTLDDSLSCRTMSCDNITILKAYNGNSSNSTLSQLKLTPIKKVTAVSNENFENLKLGIPKSIVFGRRWNGHVKYPVTPSKVVNQPSNSNKRQEEDPGGASHLVYGNMHSDDEQIFI